MVDTARARIPGGRGLVCCHVRDFETGNRRTRARTPISQKLGVKYKRALQRVVALQVEVNAELCVLGPV